MSGSPQAPIVYLHDLPGSPRELKLIPGAKDWKDKVYAPDRTVGEPDLSLADYFDGLAADVAARFDQQNVRLIGFGIGARAALELSVRLPAQVASIDLISPFGPLDGNGAIEGMADRELLELAMSSPSMFKMMIGMRAGLARSMPMIVFRSLFDDGAGADIPLAASDFFQDIMCDVLSDCFDDGGSGYRRELLAYVQPWSDLLPRIAPPVTVWWGDEDNRTPKAMVDGLVESLPSATLNTIQGASHYSAFFIALDGMMGQDSA